MIGGIGTGHASAQHSHRLLKAATTMLVSLAALLPWQTMPVVSWLTRPASFPSLIFARQCSHCWSNWGQHRCRQWYAASYASVESYCGWLFSNHAQTYCWAMDDSKLAAELDSHVCSSLHFHVQCTLHVNYHYPTRMSSNFPERVRERERETCQSPNLGLASVEQWLIVAGNVTHRRGTACDGVTCDPRSGSAQMNLVAMVRLISQIKQLASKTLQHVSALWILMGKLRNSTKDCIAVLADPNVGQRANVYSCGQQKDQKASHGFWWEHGVGCIDKKALDSRSGDFYYMFNYTSCLANIKRWEAWQKRISLCDLCCLTLIAVWIVLHRWTAYLPILLYRGKGVGLTSASTT